MYNVGGQNHGFVYQQMRDLLTTLHAGLTEQPVTSEENKKTLFDSMKQLDALAKETAIDEQADIRIYAMVQEDITQARENRELVSKLETPLTEQYSAIRIEEAAKIDQLQNYHTIKEGIKKVNKLIKDGKERHIDDEEEEIISEQAAFRMKDPITKERIEEPVKNRICGHVYDKSSITRFITDNRARRYLCQCPQPGCGNKQALLEADILDYPEFFELAVLER